MDERAAICPKCHTFIYGMNRPICKCGYGCVPFAGYTKTDIEKMSNDGLDKAINNFFHPDGVDTSSETWTDRYISRRLSVTGLMSDEEYEKKKDNDYTFWHLLVHQWFAWLFMLAVAVFFLNLPATIMVGGWIIIVILKLMEEGEVQRKANDIVGDNDWNHHIIESRHKANKICSKPEDADLSEIQKKYIKIDDWERSMPTTLRGRDLQRLYLDILKDYMLHGNDRDMLPVHRRKEMDDFKFSIPRTIEKLLPSYTREEILDYIMSHDVTFYFDLLEEQ